MCAVLPMGENTRVQLSLLNAGQNAVGAIPSVSLTDFRGFSKGLTTIARNLVGSLEKQARAIIAPEGEVLRRGQKKFSETSENPLTSRCPSAIIRAQVEARQSPERVRPMRVRKTEPMKPPHAERARWCGIQCGEHWDPKGFKCRGSTCGDLKQAGIHLVKTIPSTAETHC